MEKFTKKELIDKWKKEKNNMLNELLFCSDHKFNIEAEFIRNKLSLLDSILFDFEYCLK